MASARSETLTGSPRLAKQQGGYGARYNYCVITCPKCRKLLPVWQETCQFCGEIIPEQVRREAADRSDPARSQPVGAAPDKRVILAYYVIAIVWAAMGLLGVVRNVITDDAGLLALPFVIINLIQVVLGIGLLLRIEFIRVVVNFIAGVNLLLTAAFLIIFMPVRLVIPWGWVSVIYDLFTIAVCGLVIFLIAETDQVGFR